MNHSFDIHIAEELGLNQAIIIQHIYFGILETKVITRISLIIDIGHTTLL